MSFGTARVDPTKMEKTRSLNFLAPIANSISRRSESERSAVGVSRMTINSDSSRALPIFLAQLSPGAISSSESHTVKPARVSRAANWRANESSFRAWLRNTFILSAILRNRDAVFKRDRGTGSPHYPFQNELAIFHRI